jgi:chromosome segregation protein
VRLSSVTIQGFKSFGNRVTLEFSDRVTAVVGPNGSGKSNVLDAIKWATGGGRAREFRAEDKTDLIFHGAAGKRSLGFAEVEVELSDGRRSLTIRRDLDRDGTSRLRLNGRLARFIDVDEALAGSGLGTSGVAIIGQGEVSGVLMADPEDLLQYVAEVAGVSRLSGRREQTMARLGSARGHLTRLEDVLSTLRDEVERLCEEARDAERHQALSREALQLRVTAAQARAAGLRTEVADLRKREADGERTLATGREGIDGARSTVARARTILGEAEARYREAMARVEQRRGAAKLAAAERDRAQERVDAAEARGLEREAEVARLSAVAPPELPAGDAEALAQAAEEADALALTRRDEAAEAEAGAASR